MGIVKIVGQEQEMAPIPNPDQQNSVAVSLKNARAAIRAMPPMVAEEAGSHGRQVVPIRLHRTRQGHLRRWVHKGVGQQVQC